MNKKKQILSLIFASIFFLASMSGFIYISMNNSVDNDLDYYSEIPEIAGYETKVIRPNENYQLEWYSSDSDNINEEIEQPTEGDNNYNYETRSGIYTDIFEMSENPPSSGIPIKVTQLKLWFYGAAYKQMGYELTARLTLDVKINKKWLGEIYIENTNYQCEWHSITYTENWAPETMEDIKIKATARLDQEIIGIKLDCVYIELRYKVLESAYQDIEIKTPDAMVYTKDLSDYYPATYGFEDDENGASGTEISFVDDYYCHPDCYNKIIEEQDNHKKVLELYDNSNLGGATGGGNVELFNYFSSSQGYGTVEFWFRQSNVNKKSTFFNIHNSATMISCLRVISGYIGYVDSGGIWHNIKAISSNTWYHLRFDFELTSGNYEGLSEDHFYIYVDEVRYGEYELRRQNYDSVNQVTVATFAGQEAYDYYIWYDAFGYSWDPNYDIGDNLNEINPIEGYYPATHGFEDTADESVPHDWDDLSTGSCSISVKSQKDGHKKVLKLYDAFEAWGTNAVANTTFSPQEYGTIEFWFYTSNQLFAHYIDIKSGNSTQISLVFLDGWKYVSDSSVYDIPGITNIDFSSNTWYHIQISFETRENTYYQGLTGFPSSEKQWKIRIDDGDKFDYSEPVALQTSDAIDTLIFSTSKSWIYLGYSMFIDAIGYSWDPYYDMYDNQYEGLLLDIEPDDLDFMECTYFGYVMQIYGDTVFPMPKSGDHTINVYGEQGSSYYYGSHDYEVDFSEGIGVLFYTSDAMDGQEATPPFLRIGLAEDAINRYRDILDEKGYSRIYVYNEINHNQFYAMFECLALKRVDEQDEIFIYLWAHGINQGSTSYIHIIPFTYNPGFTILDITLKSLCDDIETDFKGLLVESCHSEGFVNEFDESPYLVMSCCKIDEDGWGSYIDPKEFYFSYEFWNAIDEGYNAEQAFELAYDYALDKAAEGEKEQHAVKADNTPVGFMFFDD
ncbi:MAG: hypothetical protein ACFFB5_24840 [Promethearchaeota archaeon]